MTPKPTQPKLSTPASKPQVWGSRMSEPPDPRNVLYCAGRDVAPRPMADSALVPFDLWQNRAHVLMLAKQGIVSRKIASRILAALDDLESLWERREFVLDPAREDVHINIEHFVATVIGPEASGSMHTARSRNDQTTTVVRLYVRDRLLSFAESLVRLIDVLLDASRKYAHLPIAGLTHYQPASVTTFGHWLASYAQALLRDLERAEQTLHRLNVSPLGAAASFGTTWKIDRAYTAQLLGFDSVQGNTLDCISTRWEFEAEAAVLVAFVLTHLSTIAQDLIVLSLPQVGIVRVADRFTTGSSIMPQKRNPDFAEVTRAKAALVQQLVPTLLGIARGLPSGYNRDTQWTKYAIMDVFDEATAAPEIFADVIATLQVNEARARESAETNFINAVDVADTLARESGAPFRVCYQIISQAVRECESRGRLLPDVVVQLAREAGVQVQSVNFLSAEQILNEKNHIGGPAPSALAREIRNVREQLQQRKKQLAAFRKRLTRAKMKIEQERKKLRQSPK
ncbi:MAG: argininosuccinate lyase [Candidatus Hydrogenedentota bacterium]|uniref:Argininosuccinate lyase n=1 Tax=Sumerlaea chitinivorans TaxID=2250252 RepID=A0A2Z4Y1Z0_SUMC1|nr:Argininosuccinate lyase [Candidatus Sumerlaea chitinivorans]MCX7963508.1 argininosuccinate lyase [Candidatus Sumerlaea chitinivorans]RMH29337.1 MAG: argininosuccinate lyase [Candidatus Hydrogenedentota bacterium]